MDKTKICRECGEEKPMSEYYRHKMMGDGHLNKCIKCVKLRIASREEEKRKNDPLWVLRERERGRNKYHRLGYGKKNKSRSPRPAKIQRAKYPEKYKAHIISQRLPKKTGFHLHHWNYSPGFEKDVIELDAKIHARFHCFLVYDQKLMLYKTMDGEALDTREKHEKYLKRVMGL